MKRDGKGRFVSEKAGNNSGEEKVRTVRANAPLSRSWKARIDEDYKNRSGS